MSTYLYPKKYLNPNLIHSSKVILVNNVPYFLFLCFSLTSKSKATKQFSEFKVGSSGNNSKISFWIKFNKSKLNSLIDANFSLL